MINQEGYERRRAFTIKSFGEAYDLGRTRTYEEIAAGRLEAVKVGGRTLISLEAAEKWWSTLPRLNAKP